MIMIRNKDDNNNNNDINDDRVDSNDGAGLCSANFWHNVKLQ